MKPSQILLCILSTFIVLGAVCVLFAGKSSVVRIPTLASVFEVNVSSAIHLDPEELSDGVEPTDSTRLDPAKVDTIPSRSTIADTIPSAPKVTALPASLPQTKLALPLFYAALRHANTQPVRVVHFGDSQIEEDRISMQLRHRLQEHFGGGGIGLIPMVQTIPAYTVKQGIEQEGRALPYTYVKRYLAYGPSAMRLKNSNCYGPMAQVAVVNEPIEVHVELLRDRVPTRDFNRVRVLCSENVEVSLLPDTLAYTTHVLPSMTDTSEQSCTMRQAIFMLDTMRRTATIRLSGEGQVYGLSLETDRGVQVDNIPMRGAAGTNFTSLSQQQLADYFSGTNTALVIMQFGGNAMPSISSRGAVERYVAAMKQQIQFVMAAAPNASLLFIGPSDMITSIEGEQQSYPMLTNLDRSLATMVEEQGGAYYSLFRLMGGAGSMFRWREKGLAGDDMIHFTRAGARKVGEMLAKQLLEDYTSIVESQKATIDSLNSLAGSSEGSVDSLKANVDSAEPKADNEPEQQIE